MKNEHREKILKGESIKRKWKLGKYLYQGVTENGFPFVVWEGPNFGSILVGTSRDGVEPKSKLRNDTNFSVRLTSFPAAKETAEWMSREIV